jgi:hypothetical protein
MGSIINVGAAIFKEGIRQAVNNHQDFASSRLRVSMKVGASEDAILRGMENFLLEL